MEFSDIALAKLLQSAPELGRLVVTFKDVTDELPEESDTQVGIFILRSGEEIFYLPVVSKSGNVFPIDSLYQVSTSKFLPITKKVMETIVNGQSARIGQSTKIPKTVVQNPSVYELINPPRTGKFVYASASRLTEFLASLPNLMKSDIKSKVLGDKDVYSKLHKVFGLEDILQSLTSPTLSIAPVHKATGTTSTYQVITGGNDLGQEEISSILQKGYAIRGSSNTSRIAIDAEDYSKMGVVKSISDVDADKDYEILFSTGATRVGYVPKGRRVTNPSSVNHTPIFFSNGDYARAIGTNIIVAGEGTSDKGVVREMLEFNPPVMIKDLDVFSNFALFTSAMELVGIYATSHPVTLTSNGATIRAIDMVRGASVEIYAFRNFKQDTLEEGNNIYVPYNSIVVKLGKDVSDSLEVNVNSAQRKRSINEMTALGSSMNIGYDGVEFSVNGVPVGGEPNIIKILVINEGINPIAADSFVKQAKENKRVKLFLSKKADFAPGEIPQFGENGPDQVDNFGAGTSGSGFIPSVKASLDTNDDQVIEATIISELLQTPDLFGQIGEYLPDIEEAVDRLGRVLFLSRLNLDKLSKSKDADSLFVFLASLKNVYRNLGDTSLKLRQLVANVPASE